MASRRCFVLFGINWMICSFCFQTSCLHFNQSEMYRHTVYWNCKLLNMNQSYM